MPLKVDKESLAALFIIWLLTGYVPDNMMRGRMTLIPKVPNAKTPDKFRPITVTSAIGRLLDCIMGQCLSAALPIDPLQRGYRLGDGLTVNLWLSELLLKHAHSAKGRDYVPSLSWT